jgi:hypothetical protein
MYDARVEECRTLIQEEKLREMYKAGGRGGAAKKAVSVFGVRCASSVAQASLKVAGKRRGSEKRREKKEVGEKVLARAASLKEEREEQVKCRVSSPSSSSVCPPSTPVELESPAFAFLSETWAEAMVSVGGSAPLRYKDLLHSGCLPPVPDYTHGSGVDLDQVYRHCLLAQLGIDPKDIEPPCPPNSAQPLPLSPSNPLAPFHSSI